MKQALTELFSSKKFLTALAGLVVVLSARYGFDINQELALSILGFFAVLIGAQGATDFGKAAATVKADGPTPAATNVGNMVVNDPAPVVVALPSPEPAP